MLHEGYVLNSELCKKSGVSNTLFRKIDGAITDKIGHFLVVKSDSLPEKYKQIAQKQCTDMGKCMPLREFERLIGVNKDLLATFVSHKIRDIKTKKVYGARLIVLTDEFIKHIKNKMVPFYISKRINKDEEADVVIDMYGMKIGFY